eukprot:CAMPEP_0196995986 /NCGR_PEP_ID=MMETSP1380-20130617/1984_1 /TAXON_ID=5936 /ORGANISM="Euplotes crassus, Strain CT5" /LENGTH=403 /DNA_ID=CAMNT_0042411819 /DNA_START=18 /DNA_END=1226 /DNA_ORIENTATION=+
MTDIQNMFTLKENNEGASNSIFGDTQSVNEDFSDTNPDSLDKKMTGENGFLQRQVKDQSDISDIEIDIIHKKPRVRDESQKSIRSSNSKAIKRLKVIERTSNSTEVLEESSNSKQMLASETYRKIKEVEYRKETIYDKNGMEITYDSNPSEYKKARKRMQNRESAMRSRYKKKHYFTELEVKVEELEEENKKLQTENATLKVEKRLLAEQLDYFKALIGNMNGGLSAKSTQERSREVSSGDLSFDEEGDAFNYPFAQIQDGELPHLGNFKRPATQNKNKQDELDERLILTRREDSSSANTAGLFFIAVIMCVNVTHISSLTRGNDSDQNKREFTMDNPGRHTMNLQKKHEEAASLLKITMWLILFLCMGIAYFTRIPLREMKKIGHSALVKLHILKDPSKKTK